MTLRVVRAELRDALRQIDEGDLAGAKAQVELAIHELEPERLLTTTEAAELLGVRSVNTVKHWCRTGILNGVKRHTRLMIPLAEVERVRDSERVRRYVEVQGLHDQIGALAGEEDLTEIELALLGRAGANGGPAVDQSDDPTRTAP